MHPVKDLKVYQKAFRLSILVYQVTRTFPKEELFGLTSQMRRCAVSIPNSDSLSISDLNAHFYFYLFGINCFQERFIDCFDQWRFFLIL